MLGLALMDQLFILPRFFPCITSIHNYARLEKFYELAITLNGCQGVVRWSKTKTPKINRYRGDATMIGHVHDSDFFLVLLFYLSLLLKIESHLVIYALIPMVYLRLTSLVHPFSQ